MPKLESQLGFGPELWIWHRKASTLCTIYPIPLMARFGTRIHRIVQSSFLDLVNLILLINLTASEDSILVHGGKICCLIHVIVVESTQQLQLDVIRVVQLRDWILDAAIISSTFLTNYDLKWLTKASTNVLMIGTAHNVLHLFSVPERPDEHAPLLSAFNTDIIAGPTNLELIHSITGIEQTALASMEFFIPATASSLGSDIWVASGTLFNDLLLWQPFNSCRLQLRGVGHEVRNEYYTTLISTHDTFCIFRDLFAEYVGIRLVNIYALEVTIDHYEYGLGRSIKLPNPHQANSSPFIHFMDILDVFGTCHTSKVKHLTNRKTYCLSSYLAQVRFVKAWLILSYDLPYHAKLTI